MLSHSRWRGRGSSNTKAYPGPFLKIQNSLSVRLGFLFLSTTNSHTFATSVSCHRAGFHQYRDHEHLFILTSDSLQPGNVQYIKFKFYHQIAGQAFFARRWFAPQVIAKHWSRDRSDSQVKRRHRSLLSPRVHAEASYKNSQEVPVHTCSKSPKRFRITSFRNADPRKGNSYTTPLFSCAYSSPPPTTNSRRYQVL